MNRPLTLSAYRALLADVAERHGGAASGGVATWYTADGSQIARLALDLSAPPGTALPFTLRCGGRIDLDPDPTAALLDLDAARATIERAIAALDELAGVVVDVSDRSTA